MAYGDENGPSGPIPWGEFEYLDFLYRIEDLQKEWYKTFFVAHHPEAGTAETEAAEAEWRRCGRALEETALEFAAYAARLRLGVVS